MSEVTQYILYKVKDMSLAEWGRQEIKLSVAEMPGLMSLREDQAKYIGVTLEWPFKP